MPNDSRFSTNTPYPSLLQIHPDCMKFHPFASERFPKSKIQVSKVDSQKVQIESFLEHIGSHESVVRTRRNSWIPYFGEGGHRRRWLPPLCCSLLAHFKWNSYLSEFSCVRKSPLDLCEYDSQYLDFFHLEFIFNAIHDYRRTWQLISLPRFLATVESQKADSQKSVIFTKKRLGE